MSININKSSFLHNDLDADFLQNLARIFPYRIDLLSKGFVYLGCYLKPSSYLIRDWLWLVAKFEKRISHWTNRMRSLGARLVLIRSVLMSIPVYWLSLFPIPASILDRLRKLIFSFLWGSSTNKSKFHLMNWKELAQPISQGGWGIKHLPNFSLSLRLKSFWLVLNNFGIWNKLISIKYLKNRPVHIWLREKRFVVQNASILWRGFVETLPWLGKGLIWNVGNGSLIRVGVDPMVGFGTNYILPVGLREYLEDYGIVTLNHARNLTTSATSYWFTAADLDLCNEWKFHWDRYIRGLEYGRILLSDQIDSLL